MNNNFMRFAERAIERAGKAGETKRAFKREQAGALAESSMAELERSQLGKTRRTGMKQAGALARTKLGGGESTRAKTGDTFGDRSKSLESAYKQMDTLFPADAVTGQRINPATGKPFSEKGWQSYAQSMSDSSLKYAGGTQKPAARNPRDGLGSLTMGGDTYNVDDRLPFGKDITKVQKRTGLAGAGAPPAISTNKTLATTKPKKKTRSKQELIASEEGGIKPAYKGVLDWIFKPTTWKPPKTKGMLGIYNRGR